MQSAEILLERHVANMRLEMRVLLVIGGLLAVATVVLLFLEAPTDTSDGFWTGLVEKGSAGLSGLLSSALVVRVFSRREQIATMSYLMDSIGRWDALDDGEKDWVLETIRAYVRKGALAAVGGGNE